MLGGMPPSLLAEHTLLTGLAGILGISPVLIKGFVKHRRACFARFTTIALFVLASHSQSDLGGHGGLLAA